MKISLFYYSQTGQAAKVAKRLFAEADTSSIVVTKQIIPIRHYPYPWGKYAFFDVFPETRLSMPPSGIVPIDFSDVEDAQLVVVVGQSWFLSPSLPLQSFFADERVKSYLGRRKIVFVNACRNMWLMTSRWLKFYFQNIQSDWVGHIVLQDHAPNLISAFTIVRWLLHGKKEGTRLLPEAGIAENELQNVCRFGNIIMDAVRHQEYVDLQKRLIEVGAISYSTSILFIEQIGHRIFGLWAKFIRQKGEMGDPRRKNRVLLFYYYLLFVLFGVSPFVQLLYYLAYPLRNVKKHKRIDCNL